METSWRQRTQLSTLENDNDVVGLVGVEIEKLTFVNTRVLLQGVLQRRETTDPTIQMARENDYWPKTLGMCLNLNKGVRYAVKQSSIVMNVMKVRQNTIILINVSYDEGG